MDVCHDVLVYLAHLQVLQLMLQSKRVVHSDVYAVKCDTMYLEVSSHSETRCRVVCNSE